MKLNDQYLRMADLANIPARKEKTYKTKNGQTRTVKAKPASRGITGFSAKHIYHLINQDLFPQPVKIGRASLWRLSDINDWLEGKYNHNAGGSSTSTNKVEACNE